MIFAAFREFENALQHYPTEHSSRPTRFGPYELDVSVDAPPAPGRFPLVLISHGNGGSPLLYRTLSLLLARSGYFVAPPRHAGNTPGDNDLADTAANFRNRPAQCVAVLDALLREASIAPSIGAERGARDRNRPFDGRLHRTVCGGRPTLDAHRRAAARGTRCANRCPGAEGAGPRPVSGARRPKGR
ncbi:MAG: hypothetical protein WDM77_21740 [Steroidobacteraceae bacterium]